MNIINCKANLIFEVLGTLELCSISDPGVVQHLAQILHLSPRHVEYVIWIVSSTENR